MERLVVFEPGEAGQGSALCVALHPQRLSHIHCLVGEAALVARRLQGYEGEGKAEKMEREQEQRGREKEINTTTRPHCCEQCDNQLEDCK